MRIVTKINLSLGAVLAVSALMNLAALELTVMPGFLELENETASRNQSRVIEAIRSQQEQVAASSRDYAFWDDSYAFINGTDGSYEAKNVNADSLEALGVNYFLAIDPSGTIKLDKGFDLSGEEARGVQLLQTGVLPEDHPFRKPFTEAASRSGLMRTEEGIVAVGYAPILTSERTGEISGTLLFGKLLDLDALRDMTKVDFDLRPAAPTAPLTEEQVQRPETIEVRTVLAGIDDSPIAVVTSRTSRSISSAGQQAVWAALALLVFGGALLIASLAFVLRRIAVKRIEAMRAHLLGVATTGSLDPIPNDNQRDELSETITSFNVMAKQLAELRESLRRQDYHHGAADQAAGILHNLRNAVSPIGTIVWDMAKTEEAGWKQNLGMALRQLDDPALPPERAQKLNQFVALSTSRLLEEGGKRQANLRALEAMVRHVDGILKDEDAVSRGERRVETIGVAGIVGEVLKLVGNRQSVALEADIADDAAIEGHRIALEQVLGNIFLNAAEAIEASEHGKGTIQVSVRDVQHEGGPALDIAVRDDGDGISPDRLSAIFEKGYSTRRERSGGLGLHWCANAVNAMNGRLYAESGGLQCGATLHLVLPRAVAELRSAA
ncbi:MAG TPA: CHASE4 domain-containing protein [Pseudorhizobium sp.]|jgi:two-component system NtrC family sensor kinase|nr:CHASE4 domain-containing protein [Pseudorhizobium sp.]